jgi:2'-5' RNA ligase
VRLFVAVEIPEAVRQAVGRRVAAGRRELPAARWVHPDNLHLTLAFLGEVEPASVAGLDAALRPAFARHAPLAVRLAGAGCFPVAQPGGRPRPARVAWVGVEVEQGAEHLRALQGDVAEAVRRLVAGEEESPPWSPHLTLARPREPWRGPAVDAFVRSFSPPLGEPFRVGSGALVASELGRGAGGGPLYRELARYPLAAVREAGP